MKLAIGLSLFALLLTTALASAAAVPAVSAVPAYRWGEEVRGVFPAQVAAGNYSLSGGLQIVAPGDVTAAPYALYANSVGVERSQPPAPTGPYLVFLPIVAR